jgi:hypothetical protein
MSTTIDLSIVEDRLQLRELEIFTIQLCNFDFCWCVRVFGKFHRKTFVFFHFSSGTFFCMHENVVFEKFETASEMKESFIYQAPTIPWTLRNEAF